MKNNSLVSFLKDYQLEHISLKLFRDWVDVNKEKLNKCIFIKDNSKRKSYTVYNHQKLYKYFTDGFEE